jgi:class 3 adenylate cyclase/tetratricopeptide (TPR) repeat protein
VVTVLFADLVGFTALSEQRDPEQVKRLVDRCFERLVADIETFGGRVDKIVGDAILALFGAPIAHEDDAERAVRAALQLHRTVGAARSDLGFDVRLRVGVNSGEVLVGGLRAGGDYTAMGDVVNTAQRLQTAAEPGQVLVGQATYLATRRAVTYRSVGAIAAKGKDALVQAWVAEGADRPPGYRHDRRRSPLVGRDDEIGLLAHTLSVAIGRRRAALLLLVGEAGLGKSRLAEEAAERARACHDALVLQGRCVPYGEANVWWPIADAVRSGCGAQPGDSSEVVAEKVRSTVAETLAQGEAVDRVVDGLLHLLGFDGVLSDIDTARARDEATRALLAFAAAVARRGPLAVVLSDLHWADDAVLEVLGALLEENARLPIVVLATARPSLAERWSPPEGSHHSVVVHLDPLEREASADLLRRLAGDRMTSLDGSVVDDLLDRASGNPFFLEELVSWLEGAHLTELPDTLRGLVAARLDELTPAERRVLEDAAVLGSSGQVDWLSLMQREVHGDDSGVVGALTGLETRDLVAVDDDAWEFRSELVREVTYGTMTKERRAKVHAGIAGWLEGQPTPQHDAVVDRIAHHYRRAAALRAELGGSSDVPCEVADRAVQWLRTAGNRAVHAHAPHRARQLFSEALTVLDSDLGCVGTNDAKERLALLLARSAVCGDLRDIAPARADAEQARILADGLGDERASVRAVITLADAVLKGGASAEAEALLDEALSRATAARDHAASASALRVRGFAALLRNDPETAIASLEPALELYRGLGDRRGRAWALQNLSWAHFIGGRIDEAEPLLHDSAALFAEIGDKGGLSWATGLLAFTRFHAGYPEDAEAMLEEAFGAAGAAGDRWAMGMGQALTASIHLWTGRAEQAVGQARAALDTFETIGDDYGRVQAVLPLGRALVTTGRIAEGFAVLEKARESLRPSDSPVYVAFSAAGLLGAAVQIGDRERAAAALAVLPALPSSDDLATAGAGELLVSQAMLALQRCHPDEALDLLGRVYRAVGERADVGYSGAVKALALAAAGRPGEALTAVEAVHGDQRSTYLDRFWAGLAAGAVAARRGDRATVDASFPELCGRVDSTDDRVAQAVARLGWAAALDVLEAGTGDQAVEASARFSDLGVDPDGWEVVFRQAVGLAPTASASR